MNSRRGTWWVHSWVVGPRGRWVLLRGVRSALLRRYGIVASYSAAHRGVLVLASRTSDVEAALSMLGANLVMHNDQATEAPETPEQLALLGGAA